MKKAQILYPSFKRKDGQLTLTLGVDFDILYSDDEVVLVRQAITVGKETTVQHVLVDLKKETQ